MQGNHVPRWANGWIVTRSSIRCQLILPAPHLLAVGSFCAARGASSKEGGSDGKR